MYILERVRLRLRLLLDDSSHLATQPLPTRGSGHLVPPMFPFLIAFHLSATICMTISTFSCVSGTAGFPVLFVSFFDLPLLFFAFDLELRFPLSISRAPDFRGTLGTL